MGPAEPAARAESETQVESAVRADAPAQAEARSGAEATGQTDSAGDPAASPARPWAGLRTVAAIVLSAAAVVAAADWGLRRVCPIPPPLEEVEDAVRALEHTDPHTLVLGSSHSRAFRPLREELAKIGHRVVTVPVEWGKHSSYRWVLDRRLRPLLDERDASGAPVRPSLSRALLVTEWWDGCAPPGGLAQNLPARAWTFRDYIADVARRGIDDHNRNYATWAWKGLWTTSILVSDRGVERLPKAVRDAVVGAGEQDRRADHDKQIAHWHDMIESAYADPLCDSPAERAAVHAMLDYLKGRGAEVTIILFARMPSTLTDKGMATTFRRYAAQMREIAAARGVKLLDWTTSSPLGDGDFAADFDHLTAEGSKKLMRWALDHDLAELAASPDRRAGQAP